MKSGDLKTVQLPSGFSFDMVFVEGGRFEMGDEVGDLWEPTRPVHSVELDSFFIGKFQVTQALWRQVARTPEGIEAGLIESPSNFDGDENRPVEQVSWDDIVHQFLPVLRKLTRLDFRLPTEAQWEFAARGGEFWQEGYLFAGSDKLKEVGWFNENSERQTHPVGEKYPNQLGIHDMSGNVWEWCADAWDEKFYEKCKRQGLVKNPFLAEAEEGSRRVLRGGDCFNPTDYCRSTSRYNYRPRDRGDGIGFRLLLPVSWQSSSP